VPVLFTIQSEPQQFRWVVAELVARLRRPFILLTPTIRWLSAACQELLANASAGCLGLATHTRFNSDGTLQLLQPVGELFAGFTPARKEPEEDLAHRAVALARNLECDARLKPPTILTVFQLYCMEGVSVSVIAQRCRVSKSVVARRLRLLRDRLGMDPARLRLLSSHLEQVEGSHQDFRARRIHPRSLLDEEPAEEDDEE
jgi:hypothetical protein